MEIGQGVFKNGSCDLCFHYVFFELCELILILSLQGHNCALHINGTVYCWGINDFGQTGGRFGDMAVGRMITGTWSNGVPVQVQGLIGSSGIVSVVLGQVCSFFLYAIFRNACLESGRVLTFA